jgi:hypothetical protein
MQRVRQSTNNQENKMFTITEGTTTTLRNDLVKIEYREDRKEIFVRDLEDRNNDPAFYTKTRRGIKKAWAAMVAEFNDTFTLYNAHKVCERNNIGTHYWCMVD